MHRLYGVDSSSAPFEQVRVAAVSPWTFWLSGAGVDVGAGVPDDAP